MTESSTVTVRVRRATRDHLNQVSASSEQTVDDVIQRGLHLIELERRRRQGELDARRLAADPADRAEVRAALREALGE